MVLCVVGSISADEVLEVVNRCLKNTEGKAIERKFEKESPLPVQNYIEEKLSVAQKQFLLGFKEDISEPLLSLDDEIASQIMLEAIAGKSFK